MLQGRSPFPYALAEMIDNSLRAVMEGNSFEKKIRISFLLNSAANPSSGLICVWDNGCGMTKEQLNNWAIMNYSMEDRGRQPVEQQLKRGARGGEGASRFLTGNLSYFGVSTASCWQVICIMTLSL